jgi:hypothetical protein
VGREWAGVGEKSGHKTENVLRENGQGMGRETKVATKLKMY